MAQDKDRNRAEITEIEELRARLEECEETLRAIRSGEVDALVVAGPTGDQIYTLQGAEKTYRTLVESMNEGAMILSLDGIVLFANQSLSDILDIPLERVMGSQVRELISEQDRHAFERLFERGSTLTSRGELRLCKSRPDQCLYAYLSLSPLLQDSVQAISAVVTDLTERKRHEAEMRVYQEHLEESVMERTQQLQSVNEELEARNEELQVVKEQTEDANEQLRIEIEERKQVEEALRESEERFRSLFEYSPDAVFLTVPEGTIKAANPAACAMFGMTEEEIVQVGREGLIDTDDARHVQTYEERRRTGRMLNVELNYIRKNGEKFPAEVSSVILSYDPPKAFVIIRDITERKRAEEALRESEGKLRLALEAGEAGMWVLDLPTNWTTTPQINTLFGRPADGPPIRFEEFPSLIHPEDQERVINVWNETLEKGVPYDIEYRVMWPDGSIHWLSSKGSVTRNESGGTKFAGISLDITGRKRVEQELEKARDEAEANAARLESFIASMADGVALFDAEGKLLSMNEVGKTILGIPAGEHFNDWSKYQRFSLDGKPISVEESASYRALRGESVKDFRYRVRSPWGHEFIMSISAVPVCDDEGIIIGATIVFRDITKQVDYERWREEKLEHEHHIAEVLQKAILPQDIPNELYGYKIATRYRSAHSEAEVGGDFYDIMKLGDDKIGVLIGDVAGKGLPAAIQVAAARNAIRAYAYQDPNPARALTLANNTLSRDANVEIRMFTAFFAVVDTKTGRVTYATAGHEPPLIRRASGSIEELEAGGMPIGVLDDVIYEDNHLELASGDSLVLLTDGITEARAPGSVLFDKSGVIEVLSKNKKKSADEIAERLMKAATRHAGGHLQDDAAVLVIEQLGGQESGTV